MRWFKHLSHSFDDEKLAALVEQCGLEAYGFYWRMLEIVAASMDKARVDASGIMLTSVSYSLSRWSRLTYLHHHKVRNLLDKLRVIGLIEVEFNNDEGGLVRVNVPNLLKYKDEYQRKSGQNPESVRTKSGECQEQETDIDQNTETEKDIRTDSGQPVDCPHSQVIELYHQILPMLNCVVEWTPMRQKLLRARWKENSSRQNLAWWSEYFTQVSRSDFLTGKIDPQNGKAPFRADLEWLIRPSNMIKVLEGKYDNRISGDHENSSRATFKTLSAEDRRALVS